MKGKQRCVGDEPFRLQVCGFRQSKGSAVQVTHCRKRRPCSFPHQPCMRQLSCLQCLVNATDWRGVPFSGLQWVASLVCRLDVSQKFWPVKRKHADKAQYCQVQDKSSALEVWLAPDTVCKVSAIISAMLIAQSLLCRTSGTADAARLCRPRKTRATRPPISIGTLRSSLGSQSQAPTPSPTPLLLLQTVFTKCVAAAG